MGCKFGQGSPQFLSFKAKWTGLAFVGNVAVLIDQVNAVWPAGVGLFGRVAEFVEDRRELNPQFAYASSCYEGTLFFILGAGKDNFVFDVALHLPHVARVRLSDVDHKKSDFASVLIVEFVEGRNLPPEWRSSVATENHDHGLLLVQGGELNSFALVEFQQGEVGRGVPYVQSACPGPTPQGFKWQDQKNLPGQVRHHAGEGLWRTVHRAPDEANETKPENEHTRENSRRHFFPATAGL
jgi:hypothetical protein